MDWQSRVGKNSVLDDNSGVVFLVKGKDNHGIHQWAYALIPPENIMAFKEAEAKGNYKLSNFGDVIHTGKGEHPPSEIVAEMKEKYGASDSFEDELYQAFKDLIEKN